MKYFKILAILLLSSVISFYSCNDNTKTPKQDISKPTEVIDPPALPNVATPKPATAEPPKNAGGVWHYTCSKGCSGGAGSAVNCDNCGGLLAHNQAYHAKANSTQSSAPFATPAITAPVTEPSQNTAGVWHYTCEKGCPGGSGAAGNCITCSGTLSHNTAYHQ